MGVICVLLGMTVGFSKLWLRWNIRRWKKLTFSFEYFGGFRG